MDSAFVFDARDDTFPATAPQSPWEFKGVTHSVEEEHALANTTSIDHKIRQQLDRRKRPEGGASSSDEGDDDTDDDDEGMVVENMVRNGRWERAGQQNEEKQESESDDGGYDEEVAEDEDQEVATSAGRGAQKRVEGSSADQDGRKPRKDVDRGGTDKAVKRSSANGAGQAKVTASGFFSEAEGAKFSAQSFAELNLSRPLLKACVALGYERPTPIQAACVPLALTGRDICGSAMTGSGKTAAFALPILERLLYRPRRIAATRVLILTPTRELAVQVHSMTEKLAQFTDVRTCLVVGGLSSKVQESALRTGPDVVVATPGRMIDHLRNSRSVGLEELAILVLDEADRLLELGFMQEVKELVRMCPRRRQTLLFSATMTEEVKELVQLSLNKPLRLSADPKAQRPAALVEEVVKLKGSQEADKEAILLALCSRTFTSKVIIFSATKHEAHRLKIIFGLAGYKAGELHGNLTQAMRLDALDAFRQQTVDFLIATDVAARGLDIIGVETVINFDCPSDLTQYVHRVGRTARAGRAGCAVTFVTERERGLLKQMSKRAGAALRSRQVAPAAVAKWREKIDAMEGDIRELAQQEREEKELRKAEMEASKAQNMLEHEAEIFARPARTWFMSPKERIAAAKAAKEAALAAKLDPAAAKKLESAEEAAERRRKEKLKKEREKHLPRKKRRRLEAEREAARESRDESGSSDEDEAGGENEDEDEDPTQGRKGEKPKGARRGQGKKEIKGVKGKEGKGGKEGVSIVEAAYRRAKAAKAARRLRESGKVGPGMQLAGDPVKKKKKKKAKRQEGASSAGGEDAAEQPASRLLSKVGAKKTKPRKAFKSKAKYKRKK